MSGHRLRVWQILVWLNLITIVGDRYCHYPYVADEETEAQRLNSSSKVTHKD